MFENIKKNFPGFQGQNSSRIETTGRDINSVKGSLFPDQIPQEEYDNLDNLYDLDRGFEQEGLRQDPVVPSEYAQNEMPEEEFSSMHPKLLELAKLRMAKERGNL